MGDMTVHTNFKNRIHPHKFALYIAMGSILMMFAAFTSAYIVRQAAGNWVEYNLPSTFFYSTAVILLSSITLHASYTGFKNNNEGRYKGLLIVSMILGMLFIALQYIGWQQLFSIGIDLRGNPSGSFLYVITAVHALHVLGGIAAIVVALIHAYTLPYKVTERRKVRFELTLHYWHFVDLLWVYLLIFLIVTR